MIFNTMKFIIFGYHPCSEILNVPGVIRSTCGGFCNSNCNLLRGKEVLDANVKKQFRHAWLYDIKGTYRIRCACYQNDYNFQLSSIRIHYTCIIIPYF